MGIKRCHVKSSVEFPVVHIYNSSPFFSFGNLGINHDEDYYR